MFTATPSSTDLSCPGRLSPQKANDLAQRKSWLISLAMIILVTGIAFATLSYSRPKFNRSEIAYAEISREMMDHQSYIVPLYHGIACIDKPVLNYWAIIPCFKIFGPSGFSARIPSLVASLTCLVIFAAAIRQLWGWQTSLLATMILATAERYFEFATLCMTDMLLTLFDTVALTALFIGLKNKKYRLLCYCLAAVSMGLGTLTKGPVALLLPVLSFLLYVLLTRQIKVFSAKQFALAALSYLLVAAPWYLAAAAAVNTQASIGAWLWHHNVERFFGSAYAFHYSPFYMVISLFSGFAPWSIFLPFVFANAIKRWLEKKNPEQSKEELYLWIWLILTTTFFTFSRGKMNYYDLPAFPAAAGLVALHINYWLSEKRLFGWLGAALLTGGLFVGAAISAYILPSVTESNSFTSWGMMPTALLIAALFATWSLRTDKPLAAYAAIFTGLCSALFAFSWQVHPAIARQAPASEYLQIMKMHPEARLAMHSDFAKTVDWFDCATFEIRRTPDQLNGNGDLAAYIKQPSPALIIVPEDRFQALPADLKEQTTIVERRPYMYDKLDLDFFLKKRGKLTGPVPLLLLSNKRSMRGR